MKYLSQAAIIIVICFVGEILNALIPLTIPAGVYGMLILLLLLELKIVKIEKISKVAEFLISIMGVMFIPAGVGIMNNYKTMTEMLLAIILSSTGITIIVMIVSGKVTQLLMKRGEQ